MAANIRMQRGSKSSPRRACRPQWFPTPAHRGAATNSRPTANRRSYRGDNLKSGIARACLYECIAGKGRIAWQKAAGYSQPAKVEAALGRWKQVIGDGLRSRIDARRTTEAEVAAHVLNRLPALRRPNYVRIV
jgi:hypothetical protein